MAPLFTHPLRRMAAKPWLALSPGRLHNGCWWVARPFSRTPARSESISPPRGCPPFEPPQQALQEAAQEASPETWEEQEPQPLKKTPETVYIALGSNMGNRVAMIERACQEMERRSIKVKRTSGLWETKPMYVVDQPPFLNGACEVETTLEPLPLLDVLQGIERRLGRLKPAACKGPRNIDLDILLYGEKTIRDRQLTVPHPGIREREFVLRPLSQLIPNQGIDPSRPEWTTVDFLHNLPPPEEFVERMTTTTPLGLSSTYPSLWPLRQSRPTLVMGIINLTPDSFSDGGTHSASRPEDLRKSVKALVAAGAHIIDVGGQSTRPGAEPVDAETELGRVVPAINIIRNMPDMDTVPISVDTYYAKVAEAAVAAGADIVNDISAGTLDSDMLPTIASLGTTVILNHTRGTPRTMIADTSNTTYPHGVIASVAEELLERVQAAEKAGIRRWRIILDPGLGFAKTAPQSLQLLRSLGRLRLSSGLEGFGWLVGPSRKGFVRQAIGTEDVEDIDAATAAAVTAAVHGGADIVRVHNVKALAKTVAMADATWKPGKLSGWC